VVKAGGSAHVYQVMKGNEHHALKIFKVRTSHLGHKEVDFLNSQLLDSMCQSSEVPSVVQSLTLQNGAFSMLVTTAQYATRTYQGHYQTIFYLCCAGKPLMPDNDKRIWLQKL
jgi:hypothetical protein